MVKLDQFINYVLQTQGSSMTIFLESKHRSSSFITLGEVDFSRIQNMSIDVNTVFLAQLSYSHRNPSVVSGLVR